MSYDIDHPPLPAGYNCDDIDGDFVDGPGTNWPVWPLLFDAFEGLTPLIISMDMQEIFANECPDITFGCPNNIVTVPWVDPTFVVKGDGCSTVDISPSSNTVAFPQGAREVGIKEVA